MVTFRRWAFVLAMAVASGWCGVKAPAAEILPVADCYVQNSDPDAPYGTADNFATWTAYMSGLRGRSYLRFALDGMPASSQIASIELNLYQYVAGGYVPIVNVYHVPDDTWSETATTWNNQPYTALLASDLLATEDIGFDAGWKSFDLLSNGLWDYDADLADGYVSLLIRSNENGDEAHSFYSREEAVEGDYAPFLRITLLPEPATLGWLAIGVVLGMTRRRGSSFCCTRTVRPTHHSAAGVTC